MANQIKIDLSLTGEQATARGLDNVGDKAEHAGDDFVKMARDAGFLDKRIGELRGEIAGLIRDFDQTGDKDFLKKITAAKRELGQLGSLRPAAPQIDTLDKRINDLRRSLSQLANEFSQTGDKSILDKIAGGKSELDRLNKLRKQLLDLGEEGGSSFGEALTKSLMNLRGPAIALAVGAGAAMAPFLGATIASAVLGAAGVGGIIGGVAMAAKDARVQDAATKLGGQLSTAFTTATNPFIAPVVEALAELEPVVERVAGSLHESFISLAPVFLPLTRGITGLVEEMMPGLTKAMEASKPVIRAIANELPAIGAAIGQFFVEISDNADEAIMAFVTLSKVIQTAIVGTGRFVSDLSDAFEFTVRAASKIAPVLEAIYGWMPLLGDFFKGQRRSIDDIVKSLDDAKNKSGDFAGSLDDVGESANQARSKMLALNDALGKFFGIAMNSEQATIAYERSWDDMIETLSKAKRTLDVHTEAGRKNREAIDGNIEAIQAMHQARVDEGMGVEDSLKIRDRELEKLRAQLLQLGYNKQQIDEIINLYKLMPELASTTIEAPGAETTIEQLREMVSLINALKGGIAIGAVAGVKAGKRASGGPVYAGQTYLVGEQGPELLQMGGVNGQVVNATQTAAMMSGASGGSSAVAVRPLVNISPPPPSGNALADAVVQMIWPFILKQVRVDGGDLAAFGAA